MKKSLILQLWIVSVLLSNVFAQEATWPIKNKKAGEGILYRPQDYIGEEFNFADLYIKALYGSDVVSPISGKISYVNYSYSEKLEFMYSFGIDNKPDDVRRSEIAKSILTQYQKSIDPKFVTLSIGILSSDGSMYYISGLRPIKTLKTGMLINKGETIGTVGYIYKTIKEPCIRVSRSVGGRSSDPMSPFGLKSTFIAPKIQKNDPKQQYTKEQLQEDFRIFRESLEEGHPGLYDYCSKQQMDSLFDVANAKIKNGMNVYEFYKIIENIVLHIRDSHTYLSVVSEPNMKKDMYSIPLTFGYMNDSLVVTRVASKDNLNLVGKKIIVINGISSDSIIHKVKQTHTNLILHYTEGFNQSSKDLLYAKFFYNMYSEIFNKENKPLHILFSDNSEITLKYITQFNGYYPFPNYFNIPKENLTFSKIDTETALMDINRFELTEMEFDSIKYFIQNISKTQYKNLIIDLRGNLGGDFGGLFKYIATKPFYTAIGLNVNQNDTYEFFKYCTNYSKENRQLFQGYKKVEGKEGYYFPVDSFKLDYPCDSIHFSGRVYVLTNESSKSAASLFAGLVHKYKRGVVVGRETGSAYQQLNALKFANVRLKNTELSLRIPLVKCIYEHPEDSDIPWGRGVLPDYPVNISLEEFLGNKDTILEYTMHLIKDNQYLKDGR